MNQLNLISAFGRGDSLAAALTEQGFHVRVLDFTASFPAQYQRGTGPFPLVLKDFSPYQREYFQDALPLSQGLALWMKDGPLELTGPLSSVHIHSHPEIQAWKTNRSSSGSDYAAVWLQRFLKQWTSSYFSEPWQDPDDDPFPAELALGMIPSGKEVRSAGFERARGKGSEVIPCSAISDVTFAGSRLNEIEVVSGTKQAFAGRQWVWCLSSVETETLGEGAAGKIFPSGIFKPEWAWVSFAGQMKPGPWCKGLPKHTVLIGDPYLPWLYSNVSVLKRSDETHFRLWIKVPFQRMDDIDARRGWAQDLEIVLQQRLPLAEWRLDYSDWNICPHSLVFGANQRAEKVSSFKNWHLISPETMLRLDQSARFELEAETFEKLIQWKEQNKEGGRRDHALHPA